jgi:hypothetical protein
LTYKPYSFILDKYRSNLYQLSHMSLIDLFRPKWRHSNQPVRYTAVEKLTDETLLARIAKNDSDENVRSAAVRKLTNRALLTDLAKSAKHRNVRLKAGSALYCVLPVSVRDKIC